VSIPTRETIGQSTLKASTNPGNYPGWPPENEGIAKNCLHCGFESQPIKSGKALAGWVHDCMYSEKVKTPSSPSNQVPELISRLSEAVKACLVLITCARTHTHTRTGLYVLNLPSRLHRYYRIKSSKGFAGFQLPSLALIWPFLPSPLPSLSPGSSVFPGSGPVHFVARGRTQPHHCATNSHQCRPRALSAPRMT